jgi:hypothetical protein
MENVGIFYINLVYLKAIGNTLWPFGIFCDNLVYFSPFWYVVPRKIWQYCLQALQTKTMYHLCDSISKKIVTLGCIGHPAPDQTLGHES